jgi:hypothetical protein
VLAAVREQDGQAGEKRQAHDAHLDGDCAFWVRISGAIQANHCAIGNTREERVQRRLYPIAPTTVRRLNPVSKLRATNIMHVKRVMMSPSCNLAPK